MSENDSSKLFPIVNIATLTQKYFDKDVSFDGMNNDSDIQEIFTQITNGFTEWGFVYIINHGINPSRAFDAATNFFKKDKDFKNQLNRVTGSNFGYVPYQLETFDRSRPFDLKECFNYFTPYKLGKEKDKQMKDFFNEISPFKESCQQLASLLLRVLSPALVKDDSNFLLSQHQQMNDVRFNPTTLRLLNYPTIKDGEILKNQLRCGEHSDYGTITLLFQDSIGGLQVVSPSGEYVNAVPVPGSIVLNVGDLLERWSSGRFKSTRHRVLVENKNDAVRQSMAYFVHPDDKFDIECLDGSDKYEKVNAHDYLMKRFSDTYYL